MKKRIRRFDAGGMASSGVQSAFTQPSSTNSGIGLGNNAPLVQISSAKDTGVGGVQTSQANGPLNIGQPVQQTQQQPQQMKKGGKVGKVGKVMGEFKSGSLKSSSGQKVTNPKQAMAIAMSEAGKAKMGGGKVQKFCRGGGIEIKGKTRGTMR